MDIQTIWKAALEEIKTQISKPSFETWFKATKPISFEGDTFVLAVPHAFAADWLMSRYRNLIEEVLRGVTGNPIKFKAIYPSEANEDEKSVMDVLIKIENRMARIEEKLDKLLDVLTAKAEK